MFITFAVVSIVGSAGRAEPFEFVFPPHSGGCMINHSQKTHAYNVVTSNQPGPQVCAWTQVCVKGVRRSAAHPKIERIGACDADLDTCDADLAPSYPPT